MADVWHCPITDVGTLVWLAAAEVCFPILSTARFENAARLPEWPLLYNETLCCSLLIILGNNVFKGPAMNSQWSVKRLIRKGYGRQPKSSVACSHTLNCGRASMVACHPKPNHIFTLVFFSQPHTSKPMFSEVLAAQNWTLLPCKKKWKIRNTNKNLRAKIIEKWQIFERIRSDQSDHHKGL